MPSEAALLEHAQEARDRGDVEEEANTIALTKKVNPDNVKISREALFEHAQEAQSRGDEGESKKTMDLIGSMNTEPSQQPLMNEQPKPKEQRYDVSVKPRDYILNMIGRGLSAGITAPPGLGADLLAAVKRHYMPKGLRGEDQDIFSNTNKFMAVGNKFMGVDDSMLPPDVGTRYMGAAAEFTAAGVVPSSIVVKGAAKKGLALTGEVSGGAGGGVMAESLGELSKEVTGERAPGEIVGGIGGAVSGYSIPTIISKIGRGADSAKKAMTNKAGQELLNIADAEKLHGKMQRSFEVAEEIQKVTGKTPNFTLGGRTGSKYIQQIEQKVLGRTVSSAEKALGEHGESTKILANYMDEVLPQPKETVQDLFGKELSKQSNTLDASANSLAAKRVKIGGILEGDDIQTVGEKLSKIRLEKMQKVKAESDAEMNEIFSLADDANLTVDMSDLRNYVKKVAGEDEKAFDKLPKVFKDIHDRYKPVEKPRASELVDTKGNLLSKKPKPESFPETFQGVHSLYRRVNRDLNATTDGTEKMILGDLKSQLQKRINTMESDKYGEVGSRFSAWNKDYREKYAQVYKEGIGGRMDSFKGSGKFGQTVDDESIVKKFFTPSGMDDFNKIYKGDPLAKQQLEDGVLRLFHKTSGIKTNGEINPAAVSKFMKDNKETLEKLPDVKTMLSTTKKATEALLDLSNRVNIAKTDLSKGLLAEVAKTHDIQKVISKGLTDPRVLRELLVTGGEARKGILHAFASSIPDAARKEGITASAFLLKNEKAIKPILDQYGKDHYGNIKIVMEGLDMLHGGKPPLHPALTKYNTDKVMEKTGTSAASLASQLRVSAMYGFISPQHVAISLGAAFWRKVTNDAAGKMQEYLLTNPQAARDFALATKSQNSAFLTNKLSDHFLSAGARSLFAASSEMKERDKFPVLKDESYDKKARPEMDKRLKKMRHLNDS